MKTLQFADLIGKQVFAFRGILNKNKFPASISLDYILFNDEQTIMEFQEQSAYDYHDYNNTAREIHVYSDSELWKKCSIKKMDLLNQMLDIGHLIK